MFVIGNKTGYENTKKLLKEFIEIVRERRKKYSVEKVILLNNGFIEQIKQFTQQLRIYRKNMKGELLSHDRRKNQ